MKKRIAGILAVLVLLLGMVPTPALAAGTIHRVSSQAEFESALNTAEAGDTIQLTESVYLVNTASNDDPLVINKQVTITGVELINGYGGILLGADVTFQNITLKFPNHACNVIAANGHTLTLNNVSWNQAA